MKENNLPSYILELINPLYIFSFALIPLIILKFSKKPGDSFLIPISIVSIIAFIFQITQITLSNLLIDKSNIVFIIYVLPISFINNYFGNLFR